MSLSIFRNQVKYCLLSTEDETLNLLRIKHKRERKFKNTSEKRDKNLRYFELQEKYKTVSKNVTKYIKLLKK
jgi:hypothetical protein